jgi:hypothetical protein
MVVMLLDAGWRTAAKQADLVEAALCQTEEAELYLHAVLEAGLVVVATVLVIQHARHWVFAVEVAHGTRLECSRWSSRVLHHDPKMWCQRARARIVQPEVVRGYQMD